MYYVVSLSAASGTSLLLLRRTESPHSLFSHHRFSEQGKQICGIRRSICITTYLRTVEKTVSEAFISASPILNAT